MIMEHFIWFIMYGVMGWIYETMAMTVWAGKWDNRGFLFGPMIPIYGFGALALTIVLELYQLNNWQVFLVSVLGSIILEFSTSVALEKLFNASWWDYSTVPLNIQGRICVPASLGFGIAGLIVKKICMPFVVNCTRDLNTNIMQLIALVLMSLLAADTATTVADLISFDKKVKTAEDKFNEHMDNVVGDNIGIKTRLMLIKEFATKSQQGTLKRVKHFKGRRGKSLSYMVELIKKVENKFDKNT